jgi:dUTP pyrophosphatase
MTINIINKSQHALPNYETIASAGMDLRANLTEPTTLESLGRTVKTGLFHRVAGRLRAQVRPRERIGFQKRHHRAEQSWNHRCHRGEIGVILVNLSDKAL